MSQDFEIPPMGADNLPLKEMEKDISVVAKPVGLESVTPKKKNLKTILVMVLIVAFTLIMGLMLGATLRPAGESVPKPTASAGLPSPETVQS